MIVPGRNANFNQDWFSGKDNNTTAVSFRCKQKQKLSVTSSFQTFLFKMVIKGFIEAICAKSSIMEKS